MFPILATSLILAFCASQVTALTSVAVRQSNTTGDCTATCANNRCFDGPGGDPDCGCTVAFLQAEGECMLCRNSTPTAAASAQYQLNEQSSRCRSTGINVEDVQIQLSPAAVAIFEQLNRNDEEFRQKQTAFFALQITGGHVGLVLLLLCAIFSRNVARGPTFFNFCITWIISSVVFSILLYRGTEGNTTTNLFSEVPLHSCIAQAALTSGVQVMTACSKMALVIQIWINVRAAIHGPRGPSQTRWTTIGLLSAPYILLLAFSLPAVLPVSIRSGGSSVSWRAKALPSNFYCMLEERDTFLLAVYGAMLGILAITLFFDVCIINILYRHWRVFRQIQTKRPGAVSLSVLVRVIIFTFYRAVVAVAYGTVLVKRPGVVAPNAKGGIEMSNGFVIPIWVDMLQATVPLVAFLVFGTNTDIINALTFWPKKQRVPQSIQPVDNTTTSTVNRMRKEHAILDVRADTSKV